MRRTKTFLEMVSRVNADLDDVVECLDFVQRGVALTKSPEADTAARVSVLKHLGRPVPMVIEECQIDKGLDRVVIRVSVRLGANWNDTK